MSVFRIDNFCITPENVDFAGVALKNNEYKVIWYFASKRRFTHNCESEIEALEVVSQYEKALKGITS